MKLARVKEELAKQSKGAVSELDNEMQFLKNDNQVTETSVKEGNQELGEAMKGKTMNQDKIVLCQSKITMGLKWKTELKEDLRKFEGKK